MINHDYEFKLEITHCIAETGLTDGFHGGYLNFLLKIFSFNDELASKVNLMHDIHLGF